MEHSPAVLLSILGVYIVIGLVWKIPLPARIGIQVVMGVILYTALGAHTFELPNSDNLPMSELYGGAPSGGFNKFALGFLGTVIGILASIAGAVLGKLLGKKED